MDRCQDAGENPLAGIRTVKKVLVLAYYFPPLGMGGTQRPAKFVRYLPEFGWEATVLTVKPIAYWAQDPSLLDELRATPVMRTGSLDPQRLLLLARGKSHPPAPDRTGGGSGGLAWINSHVLPWFLLPDSKILWRFHALRAAARLLKSGCFDAIFSTSPPHSTHLIARRLARRFRLPWVADLRDAWTESVVVHAPTRWHRRRQAALERRVVRAATILIGVTPGIVAELEAAGATGKALLIPNGYDADDFADLAAGTSERRERPERTKPFTLCHCGSISRFSDPAPLFDALRPEDGSWLQLSFVGYDAHGGFRQRVEERGLAKIVLHEGYQPHRQALAAMAAADALVLIACDEPRARFIPGKTYEYLASRKPILLISNVEETIRLLQAFPGVLCCAPDQPDAIRASLQRLRYDRELIQAARSRELEAYERRHQTGILARLLNQLTDREL